MIWYWLPSANSVLPETMFHISASTAGLMYPFKLLAVVMLAIRASYWRLKRSTSQMSMTFTAVSSKMTVKNASKILARNDSRTLVKSVTNFPMCRGINTGSLAISSAFILVSVSKRP